MLPTPPTSSSEESVPRARFPSSTGQLPSSTASLKVSTADMYRQGAPHETLRALPQDTRNMSHSSAAYQAFEKIRVNIGQILHARNINPSDFDLVHRWDRWQGNSAGLVTVFVQAKKSEHWTEAICEIIDLVYERGHLTWAVEFIDKRAIENSFPAQLSPSFNKDWPSLESKILDIIGIDDRQWRTLSVLNRGHTEADSTPTVIIGLTEKADVQ